MLKKLYGLIFTISVMFILCVSVNAQAAGTLTYNGKNYNVLSDNLVYNGNLEETYIENEEIVYVKGWTAGYCSNAETSSYELMPLCTKVYSNPEFYAVNATQFTYTEAGNYSNAYITTPVFSMWDWQPLTYPYNPSDGSSFATIHNWFKDSEGNYIKAQAGKTYYMSFMLRASEINALGCDNIVNMGAYNEESLKYRSIPYSYEYDAPGRFDQSPFADTAVLDNSIKPGKHTTQAGAWVTVEAVGTASEDGYFAFQCAWANEYQTYSLTGFTIFEVEEIVEKEEEINSYTELEEVSVISGNHPILPLQVEVTGTNGSEAIGTITWNEPASYSVGTVTVFGTLSVQFDEAATIQSKQVSIEVSVLPQTFSVRNMHSNEKYYHDIAYFPVDIKDAFYIEFDYTPLNTDNNNIYISENARLWGNGQIGLNTTIGGNLKALPVIESIATLIPEVTYRVVIKGDASKETSQYPYKGTYDLTIYDSILGAPIVKVTDRNFRNKADVINSMIVTTNGNDGNMTVSNILVYCKTWEQKKVTYNINSYINGSLASTLTGTGITSDIALEDSGLQLVMDGYETTIEVENSTINVYFSNMHDVTVDFVNTENEVVYSVTQAVAAGESFNIEATEVVFINSTGNGTIYSIPQTSVYENSTINAVETGNGFNISEGLLSEKIAIICVGIKDDAINNIQSDIYDGTAVFETQKNSDSIKLFIWESLTSMIPLCEAISVK